LGEIFKTKLGFIGHRLVILQDDHDPAATRQDGVGHAQGQLMIGRYQSFLFDRYHGPRFSSRRVKRQDEF